MIHQFSKILRGRSYVAYGAGDYFDRCYSPEIPLPEYFVDAEIERGEKKGREIRPLTALLQEPRDLIVIIFLRRPFEALLKLQGDKYHWKENVWDARFFGVGNPGDEDFEFLNDWSAVERSAHIEVFQGIDTNVDWENNWISYAKTSRKIELRLGTKSTFHCKSSLIGAGASIHLATKAKFLAEAGVAFGSRSWGNVGSHARISLQGENLISEDSILDAARGTSIDIGAKSTFGPHLQLYAYAPITIGADCMFSTDIYLESGAGHDLLVEGQYKEPQELSIGDHVWVGLGSKILAGSGLEKGSMVAAGSVVTKIFSAQELIAGNPAKSIRNGIEWSRDYTAYKKIYHTINSES